MSVNEKKNIMFLAPELPALSATFVYNELVELRALGHKVFASSVHEPSNFAENSGLTKDDVFFLYRLTALQKFKSFLKITLKHPKSFVAALFLLLKDVYSLKLLNRIALGQVYRFYVAASLADNIVQNNIKHMHIHFAHVPTDIGMYAARMALITYSVQAHANDIFERGWLLNEKIQRSKFFATISEYNIKHLHSFSTANNKLKVIHCGVDRRRFQARTVLPNNKQLKVGLLGRLVEKKGTIYLLKAALKIKNSDTDVTIEIIGDGPLLGELKAFVKNNNLNNVSFLGKKPNHEISQWLNYLDCFVLPCVKDKNGDMDGIPVSLMEAMIIGIPVISTNISGLPELIINKETGLLIETKNIDELAEAIYTIKAMDKVELLKLTESARSHILNNFEIVTETTKLSKLIEE